MHLYQCFNLSQPLHSKFELNPTTDVFTEPFLVAPLHNKRLYLAWSKNLKNNSLDTEDLSSNMTEKVSLCSRWNCTREARTQPAVEPEAAPLGPYLASTYSQPSHLSQRPRASRKPWQPASAPGKVTVRATPCLG